MTIELYCHDESEFEDIFLCAEKFCGTEVDRQWLENLNRLYRVHGLKAELSEEQYQRLLHLALG